MVGEKRVIAIIPARGGSKSVPGKNIRDLGGRPLIDWTIRMALDVEVIDRVIVSTDDHEIANVAGLCGAEVMWRPSPLATDTSRVLDTVVDLAERLKAEGERAPYGLLLEPTSPFRRPEFIHQCLKRLAEGLDSVATFKPAELNPHRAWKLSQGELQTFIEGAIPWLPRQALPEAYQLSGDVYAFRLDRLHASCEALLFGRMGAVVVDGRWSLDIDTLEDFMIAEYLVKGIDHEQITA
ncbi:acylneuraminate cytidylyltransferase family protein [Halomonas sp. HP20-15]|uniref:acylneuraminate cytidylyltransferase family protein n=1 Tax=Halomonas sp. HP20-15 TaxID=3085901 RepID=UPI002982907D|nr:acylneuraminate cytidylyltransferase family protein [Halomonas sp. HP20-15]MDW5377021.1 acylneuraminate cytidylyltransferase family protein [Halomonas sp. HP20-15]